MARMRSLVAVAAASLMAITGCSPSSTAGKPPSQPPAPASLQQGGTLTIGLDREVQTLDVTTSVIGQQPLLILANAIYEPLMAIGDRGAVEPGLAESLTPDKSATKWTLRLREGVKFSDGSPLTSQQVIGHIKRMADPTQKASVAGQARLISDMATPDDRSVVFTLTAPNADFPGQLARNLGMITSASAKDAFGFPLGAGPYKVTGFVAGSSVTVERNENYWGKPGKLDKITYVMIPDADSRYQSLASKDVDVIWTEVASQFQQARSDSQLAVYAAPAAMSSILLNVKNGKFKDAGVRHALAQAIDRNAINTVVNLGEGKPVDNPFALLGDLAPDSVGYPAYDPAAAKKVLEGKGLSFSLTAENRADTIQRATALKHMFAAVGVSVEIKPIESASFSSTLKSGEFEAADFVTSLFADPAGARYLFHSKGPYNFTGYGNATVDEALSETASVTDQVARSASVKAVSKGIASDLPALWLTANHAGFIARSNVGGIPDLSSRTLVSLQPARFGFAGR